MIKGVRKCNMLRDVELICLVVVVSATTTDANTKRRSAINPEVAVGKGKGGGRGDLCTMSSVAGVGVDRNNHIACDSLVWHPRT